MSAGLVVSVTRSNDEVRAFGQALAALHDDLYARAMFLTRDPVAAEDLLQESYERALLAQDRFQPGTNLRAWVGSIMRNLFVDGCRRRTLHPLPDREPLPDLHEGSRGPLDVLSIDDLAAALDRLAPREKEIIVLACFNELSYREISARMRVPLRTAGTRLHRAKAKLRALLADIYDARLQEVRRAGAPAAMAPRHFTLHALSALPLAA